MVAEDFVSDFSPNRQDRNMMLKLLAPGAPRRSAQRSYRYPPFCDDIVALVHREARRRHIRAVDIPDLVQDVVAAIVASMHNYRPELGTFPQWAYGLACNMLAVDARQRTRINAHFDMFHPDMHEIAAPAPVPERCVELKEAACDIARCMATLSPLQAEVLVMHGVDDMKHHEIATVLRISEASSQKCYQRARNKMAECVTVELVVVIPPYPVACDDASVPRKGASKSRFFEESSHYALQISTMLVVLFLAAIAKPQLRTWIEGEIHDGASSQNNAMYTVDKHVFARDERAVRSDTPPGKPEPAPLPSVRAVPKPTRTQGKPVHGWSPSSLPPYNHVRRSDVHAPRGRDVPQNH